MSQPLNVAAPVADLRFQPGGPLLAVAAGESVVTVDLARATMTRTAPAGAALAGIAFSPDGERLAAACEDGTVRVIELVDPADAMRMEGDRGGFHSVAWAPNRSLLAAGHFEPWVTLFDAMTGEPLVVLDPDVFDDEGRTKVAYAPDGVLVSTAFDRVMVWSLPKHIDHDSRPRKRTLQGPSDFHLIDADLSDDGKQVVALAELEGQTSFEVWSLSSGRLRGNGELPRHCHRVVWLPGGRSVAVSEWEGQGVQAWNVDSGTRLDIVFEDADSHDIDALAVAPDHGTLFGGTVTGDVLAWDLASGRRVEQATPRGRTR